ncbi:MAG: hypothetical protein OXG62_15250 [Nitrospinae bacterium]|nr:hypothetical protein [Nitrospinota bacterium]
MDALYLYWSLESMIPPGIHIHVDDALRAVETMKDLADAPNLIFAGYDETDLRREEVYPGVRMFVWVGGVGADLGVRPVGLCSSLDPWR